MKTKVIITLSYIVLFFTASAFAGDGKLPKCCKNKEACCEAKSACCTSDNKANNCCEENDKCCEAKEACCNHKGNKGHKANHCSTSNSEKSNKTCCK